MRPWSLLKKEKRNHGMTLVEVLMAATIFSVIAVGVAGTFFAGVKLWLRISTVDVAARFLLLDLHKLSKDLHEGIDVPLIGFEGAADGLSFPVVEGARVVKVTYAFDAARKGLIRRSFVFDPSAEIGKTLQPSLEAKALDADEISFSYLDNTAVDAIEWLDAWPKERGIFRAVRVEGMFKGESFSRIIIMPQA